MNRLPPGPDGIHPKVLRECCDNVAYPIWLIFQKSLKSGVVPSSWREANITPIFKSGSKSDSLNYRPISLTSVVCKLLEKLITNKITNHLETNNLLTTHQHGFRSKRSCLTQLPEYFKEVEDALVEHDPVDVIYLDCRKAFDTVPHARLKVKLEAYGIQGYTYSKHGFVLFLRIDSNVFQLEVLFLGGYLFSVVCRKAQC